MGFLGFDAIAATRRNHALEHAAVTVLLERGGFRSSLAGRSTPNGFYIYGAVAKDDLSSAVDEGLRRLQRGEEEWAVSPFCGTNLAMTGILAAMSVLSVTGPSVLAKNKLPNAIIAAVVSAVAAQPLGRLAQKYITTSPHVNGLRVTEISALSLGSLGYYWVSTEHAAT